MVVLVTTLDILTQRARFDPEVARAIGDAITNEITQRSRNLATTQDLTDSSYSLRQEMSGLRREMAEFKSEIRLQLAHLKSEMLTWMFVGGAGFSTLVLGGVYFMLERMLP